jgi:hypothetical protein
MPLNQLKFRFIKMKKLLFITILIIILLGIWQTCQAAELLLDYPNIPRAGTLTTESTLPQIVRYIYMFALGAAGFVALLAILIGAFMYITSAGNASKMGDAKDRIMSAILGIIILLASVLILRTINPDLVNIGFKLPEIKGGETAGNYACYCCCYVINKCDPLSKPEYKRWCSTNLTLTEATEGCYKECDFYQCPHKVWQGYEARVVAEPCNK